MNPLSKRGSKTKESKQEEQAADGSPIQEAEPEAPSMETRTGGRADAAPAEESPPPPRPVAPGVEPMTGARVIRTADDEATARQKLSEIPMEQREFRVNAVTYFDGGQTPALPGSTLKGLTAAQAKTLLDQGAIVEIIPGL